MRTMLRTQLQADNSLIKRQRVTSNPVEFDIYPPESVEQCKTYTFSWHGGVPPYHIKGAWWPGEVAYRIDNLRTWDVAVNTTKTEHSWVGELILVSVCRAVQPLLTSETTTAGVFANSTAQFVVLDSSGEYTLPAFLEVKVTPSNSVGECESTVPIDADLSKPLLATAFTWVPPVCASAWKPTGNITYKTELATSTCSKGVTAGLAAGLIVSIMLCGILAFMNIRIRSRLKQIH
jgi:hypothetical protein